MKKKTLYCDRTKRKMYKHYERAEYGINQKPSEKDLNYAEYYQWLGRATMARDDYLAEKISKKEALGIIEAETIEVGHGITSLYRQ